MTVLDTDTIVAQATPPGRGGVGILRVSGPRAAAIATAMIGFVPRPRYAHYTPFLDAEGLQLDQGIALFFPNPHSFTGEDVFELQGHGGPVILDLMLRRILSLGARLARPGEFSERAFLNDKLDLAQAEAIADLIDAASEQAARCAVRSLQGEFSQRVQRLVEGLIQLRIYVEAAIDFPEEEIDFLADGHVAGQLQQLRDDLATILKEANQGALLREGMNVVIAGRPNAGKSSLLNALSGRDTAIVTDIEGTTRDILKEQIQIDGMPLHIIDTAGLRDTEDRVEQIGVERAWSAIRDADRVLLVVDASRHGINNPQQVWEDLFGERVVDKVPAMEKLTLIRNKIDLSAEQPGVDNSSGIPVIRLSAQQGQGLEGLREHLKACMGYDSTTEGGFIARRRHLDALERAAQALVDGARQLNGYGAGELLAEDLRMAQDALNEITGEFRPDDLLGRIFSSFCIGK
ncbi:tRNA uridine-5-carboxymethylaminomethyl(34) synthesis GTPase MnmE [Pokkaliibacter plantistimulans]|uniref:tRNA uridine-5-carboxymethylaminomethyl(34) synthesis GTPase MnmE n=1 Tax=Pokkaliibacter plantistimulans TaxID=1635171 RepID=UPI002D79F82B|nr:tRNA uridine-5-carboxymethylaminomethyl(34) synthesis GTPase MnmE [Pokkaliibacter plantistimulans]